MAREYIVNPMRLLTVEDVMVRDVPTMPANLGVDQLFHRVLHEDPSTGAGRPGRSWTTPAGWSGCSPAAISFGLIETTDDHGPQSRGIDLGSGTLVVAHPDELLATAADRMLRAAVGRLPVVRRDDPQAARRVSSGARRSSPRGSRQLEKRATATRVDRCPTAPRRAPTGAVEGAPRLTEARSP